MEKQIEEINKFIGSKPWFDFELTGLVNKNLKIIGSTDFSYFHEIEIVFEGVAFLQCPDNWKSDTSSEILVIAMLEEQRQINISYEIEQGYVLLKFIAEDIGAIYVSCKSIDFKIEKIIY